MSDIIKAGCAIGALVTPAFQAHANVGVLEVSASAHRNAATPLAGKATPGQVGESMRRLGMTVLDTPVTSLLSGEQRVAATQGTAAVWCNSNWCVSPKPDNRLTTSVHSVEGLLERSRRDGTATLASLLEEMDRIVGPGEAWSVTQTGRDQFAIG